MAYLQRFFLKKRNSKLCMTTAEISFILYICVLTLNISSAGCVFPSNKLLLSSSFCILLSGRTSHVQALADHSSNRNLSLHNHCHPASRPAKQLFYIILINPFVNDFACYLLFFSLVTHTLMLTLTGCLGSGLDVVSTWGLFCALF